MSIADLHDIAEKLHAVDQERQLNASEDDSVRLSRKLIINMVRELDWLSQRVAKLEGKDLDEMA